MTAARAQRVGIAVLGLAAFAAVVIWFGIVGAERQDQGPAGSAATVGRSQPSAAPQEGAQAPAPAPAPQQAAQAPAPAPPVEAKPEAPRTGAGPAEEGRSKAAAAPAQPEKPNGAREGAIAPSFDIVRVEPSGESVIAGRATPGATVEMLRNGSMHARVASDPSGLFAFVPQPLPPGTSEIVLQSIAPDGTRMHSRESVTIVVAPKRDAKPLVAMTSPDRPTVVLSSPDEQAAPADKPASPAPPPTVATLPEAAAPAGGSPPSEPAATAPANGPTATAAPPPKPRAQVKIASVEAEEGGRLFVSGKAAPGATVRLYLNETLVAPGGAGSDGRIAFAIGRGVRPGAYRVRLDDVDPVSGDVKSRAEVEFRVPAPLTVELPPPAAPYVTNPPVASAGPAKQPEAGPVAPEAPAPSAARQAVASAPGVQAGTQTASSAASSASPPSAPAAEPGPPAKPAPGARTAAVEAEPHALRDLDPGTILVPEVNTAIVGRGDNLWRISRRVYGRGVRYTVIYTANQEQIRSRHLIYPGQVFVLPADSAQNAAR